MVSYLQFLSNGGQELAQALDSLFAHKLADQQQSDAGRHDFTSQHVDFVELADKVNGADCALT